MTNPVNTTSSDAFANDSHANSHAGASSPHPASSAKAAGSTDPAAADVLTAEPETIVVDGEPIEEAPVADELVAQAQAEVAEWKDKYMRLHAEWDTYRRRTNEQRAEERVLATQKLVEGLLPVLDDFERTIEYAKNSDGSGLLSGVEAVQTKLLDILQKDGVQIINPEGEAFDALEAQAVATVDDPSVPDETVAQVYQKGYRMGAKVLRPAMVTVTTGGPKRPKPQEDETSVADTGESASSKPSEGAQTE